MPNAHNRLFSRLKEYKAIIIIDSSSLGILKLNSYLHGSDLFLKITRFSISELYGI